jgi:TrpR-related protein YerC/YecD
MSKRRLNETNWSKDPAFKRLCRAFLDCSTQNQIQNFLRDVATLSELQAMSERLDVARELTQGNSYRAITDNTGASTTTGTRVANFRENGHGYRHVLGFHHHWKPGFASRE